MTQTVDTTRVGDGVWEILEDKMPLAEIYRVYLIGPQDVLSHDN
jgi:hypothetical protein